jgi:hypothetical protein
MLRILLKDSKAWTLFGWTPGLRLVSGRTLRCGCLTGIYHSSRGESVTILDAQGRGCDNPAHRRNAILWRRFDTVRWPFGEQVSSDPA